MNIAASDARGLFTKMLMDVYQERIRPKSFFRSFFRTETAPTKEISIEVERGFEKVSVDVVRGSEGYRNVFGKSTEKIFVPPLYREYFDATQLDLYDRVLGSQGNANENQFVALMNKVSDRLGLLQDKIDRAYELQCSQVVQTGIVTLQSGIANIDYKRKALSLVDDSGSYFASAINPFTPFETACNFLRQVGKAGITDADAVLGSTAFNDLLGNTIFKARQNLFNMALDQVAAPQRNSVGAALMGYISAGAYRIRLWTYPEFYDNASGTATAYMDPKKVVVLPPNPRFLFSYAAVPQLIEEPGEMPVQGAYIVGEFRDKRKAVHDFDIQSAGLAVPVAVDQVYTFKAVA